MATEFPPFQTPSIFGPFQAARWRPKAAEDKCLKGRREPLLIKAGDASGKTGKQKRKWSETMEQAGSKHLMECPARQANKPFQIERSGRRLNGTTWHISPTFIQLARTYRRKKNKTPTPPTAATCLLLSTVCCSSASLFSSSAINSEDWITAAFQAE